MLFKEAVQEYQALADLRAPSTERLEIRSDIAQIINSGEIYPHWYLNAVVLSALNYQSNDFDKSSRQPTLTESIIATENLNKKYKELVELLSPKVRSIIKIGSSTWAENFNVRNFQQDKSDLDLEVLIDDVSSSIGEGLPGAEAGLETFMELYKRGQADYFSYGFKSDGIPISIHFMPTATFKKNCSLNILSLSKLVTNVEFRTKPKSKPPIYDERYDGSGKEFVFKAKPQEITGGILTEVPVMMVGPENQIVMGLVPSKYFTYPKVDGDQQIFERYIAKFKQNLNLRLAAEGGGGKFTNMPARKNLMPNYVLHLLDKEQRELQRKNLKTQPWS